MRIFENMSRLIFKQALVVFLCISFLPMELAFAQRYSGYNNNSYYYQQQSMRQQQQMQQQRQMEMQRQQQAQRQAEMRRQQEMQRQRQQEQQRAMQERQRRMQQQMQERQRQAALKRQQMAQKKQILRQKQQAQQKQANLQKDQQRKLKDQQKVTAQNQEISKQQLAQKQQQALQRQKQYKERQDRLNRIKQERFRKNQAQKKEKDKRTALTLATLSASHKQKLLSSTSLSSSKLSLQQLQQKRLDQNKQKSAVNSLKQQRKLVSDKVSLLKKNRNQVTKGTKVHKNSLDYVGDTHVYRVKGPDGSTYKVGESAQGTKVRDGASIRAEQQARRLTRETGDTYTSEIRKTFPDKASARDYETRVIERFRRMYGQDTLPGNKTNR